MERVGAKVLYWTSEGRGAGHRPGTSVWRKNNQFAAHLRSETGLHKVDSGASAASGQTKISWINFDQYHIYFVQALHGK